MNLCTILDRGMELGADFIEIREEHISGSIIHYHMDGTADISSGSEKGVGIRIAVDGNWCFLSSNSLDKDILLSLIESGINSVRKLSNPFFIPEKVSVDSFSYPEKKPAHSIPIEDKITMMESFENIIKDVDPRIMGAELILEEHLSQKRIYSSQGTTLELNIPHIYFNPRILAQDGNQVSYRRNLGSIGGYEFFDTIDETLEDFARRAVHQLTARRSPQGVMDVVLDCPLTGVLAHEVLGHSLEGDAILSGNTVMHDNYLQHVGPDILTLIDDPTMEKGWGSFHYDDEGIPAHQKMLIKNGVISEIITDSQTASRLDMPCNGGSRAQSYLYPPLIRMSDIFIEPCDFSPDELFEDIQHGMYLRNIVGGHSDPTRGMYNFEICESYLIEHGEIADSLSKSTVSGDILSTLSSITGIGKDFELNAGYCYKGGQCVPVGIGGPHMKIEGLRIGGTA